MRNRYEDTAVRDGYQLFFYEFGICQEEFIECGINSLITAPKIDAEKQWEELKRRIYANEKVFMRGYGQKSVRSHIYQKFFGLLVNNKNVQTAPSNNTNPTKIIKE